MEYYVMGLHMYCDGLTCSVTLLTPINRVKNEIESVMTISKVILIACDYVIFDFLNGVFQ